MQESLAIYQSLNDQWGASRALAALALPETRLEKVKEYLEKSLALCRKIKDEWGIARALMNLGGSDVKLPRAITTMKEALSFYQKIGNRFVQAHILRHMGRKCVLAGEYEAAATYLKQSERLSEEIGRAWGHYPIWLWRMNLARVTGAYNELATLAEGAQGSFPDKGWLPWTVFYCDVLGRAAQAQGDNETAAVYFQEAFRVVKEADDPGLSLNDVGILAYDLGFYKEAHDCFQQSLILAKQKRNTLQTAGAYNGIGRLAVLEGNYPTAITHCQQALDLVQEMGEIACDAHLFAHFFMGQARRRLGHYEAAQRHLGEAVKKAEWSGQTPRTLEILIEAARLFADMDNLEWAAALLALVVRHPASEQTARDQATADTASLAVSLSPETLSAAQRRGAELPLGEATASLTPYKLTNHFLPRMIRTLQVLRANLLLLDCVCAALCRWQVPAGQAIRSGCGRCGSLCVYYRATPAGVKSDSIMIPPFGVSV